MPLLPNLEEAITFLVHRKFGSVLAVLQSSPNQPRPNRTAPLDRALSSQERDRYRTELRLLPADKLTALYEAECALAIEEAQREENGRFFNLPHTTADFGYWSKMEHWSLDEAVALAMGKAPEFVSWEKIKAFNGTSPFVAQYARLRTLAQRAMTWQKLFDPVSPTIFIKWADDNEIAIPPGLRENVEKLKGKLADWKKLYADLKEMYGQHIADFKGIVEKQSALITARNELIQASQARVAQLEMELAAIKESHPAEPAKAQSTIERQNMLKAIYVLATKGYGYDPTQKRSTIVPEIVNDLTLAGLPLSEDTVRRYLKEASDKLVEWTERSR
ncbi:hypothetical protein [Bradyrhizobium guangzhouense]|uniref:hypothetical protein n=1 Tax=Bradyrhizobium guangzhouense TaxID=1325095 RepID=UPI001009C9CC|nr:hypothetical protein [Bradyrhizobium guangzhouense]RXH19846.1 hypothetical protein EAS54_06665 [Bradyrhizobium guangzhouense]